MKNIIILIILITITSELCAQEKFLKDSLAIKELSTTITKLFSENKISKVFKKLTPYWPIPQNEIEAVEVQTIKYLNMVDDRFGKAIGFTKIKNETIKDFAIRETYLVRYENTAIRLMLSYYRNNNGWIVNSFKWDDSFTEEFR